MAEDTPIRRKSKLFEKVFSSPDGQKVLRMLMAENSFCNTTFEAGDPYTSAFYEGKRSVVASIIQRCVTARSDPDYYIAQSLISQQESRDV